MTLALPTGRTGRALALGLTLVVLASLWAVAVAPLVAWYGDRADAIAQHRALARRMAELAETLPGLQRRSAAATASGPAPETLLEGGTDAIAGAALQEAVQAMAGKAGASLASVEMLPVEPDGSYRRIGLRVSLTTPWPVLIHLLQSVEQATPRMLIDDLQVHGARLLVRPDAAPLDVAFTVLAFRAGAPQAGRPKGPP